MTMHNSHANQRRRAIIIGGSLGGLFTGVLLRSIGWQVDIYERSPHDLSSRGGGIVVQPEIVEAFQRAQINYEEPLGVVANERLYLTKNGDIAQQLAMRQTLTSWNLLYGNMYRHFPTEHYHKGKTLAKVQQQEETVTAIFTNGAEVTGDLLIGADGASSTVRQQLSPSYQPHYAGYVAYRGLVDETDLPAETARLLTERFVFYQFPNSRILQYLIPGKDESIKPGARRFNWVWYVNYDEISELPAILTDKTGKQHQFSIPPGMMAQETKEQMHRYAFQMLPPPFQQLITATKEPFVQTILDLAVPQMAFHRIALVGDAAFIPRPHTAAGVSKGAANAIDLGQALVRHHHDVTAALATWETNQLRLGRHLEQVGKSLGDRSQFAYGKQRSHTKVAA